MCGFVVGVDVGGTKISGVLLDDQGVIRKEVRVATKSEEGADAVLSRIGGVVRRLSRRKDLLVGVSFPGHIDREGLLHDCPHLPSLEGVPLRQRLQRYVAYPLVVENDANCFVLAEHWRGKGRDHDHVVGVVIGTGIGVGVISHGFLLKGWNGGVGELGHLPFPEASSDSDVESFAAGPGLMRRFFSMGGSASQAERLFEKKGFLARKALRGTAEALGWLCSVIERAYDPEIIILGGGVANAPILQDVHRFAKARGVQCRIERHALGDDAGRLGAALLARRLFSNEKV